MLLMGWAVLSIGQKSIHENPNKSAVIASIDSKKTILSELSDKIWSYEEIAFQETRSAKALAEFARAQGFTVKEGVADIPTALVAEYSMASDVFEINFCVWDKTLPLPAGLRVLSKEKMAGACCRLRAWSETPCFGVVIEHFCGWGYSTMWFISKRGYNSKKKIYNYVKELSADNIEMITCNMK